MFLLCKEQYDGVVVYLRVVVKFLWLQSFYRRFPDVIRYLLGDVVLSECKLSTLRLVQETIVGSTSECLLRGCNRVVCRSYRLMRIVSS